MASAPLEGQSIYEVVTYQCSPWKLPSSMYRVYDRTLWLTYHWGYPEGYPQSPIVQSCLVFLVPSHYDDAGDYWVRPMILETGEARVLVGYYASDGWFHYGWATYNAYYPDTARLQPRLIHCPELNYMTPPLKWLTISESDM